MNKEIPEKLHLKHAKDHPNYFYDGDRYLVAICNKSDWEFYTIRVRADDDEISFTHLVGEDWEYFDCVDFDDFDYYIKID